jgi:hypothetical protein
MRGLMERPLEEAFDLASLDPGATGGYAGRAGREALDRPAASHAKRARPRDDVTEEHSLVTTP